LSGPGRETMMSLFTIQSCQTDTLSLHAPALFDPIKAEAEYTEKLVALSTRFSLQRVDFEASKAAFEETKREAIAELENAVAAVEQKQEQAYAALDASKAALQKEEEERQAALAVEKAAIAKREDECRAIELQFFEKLQAIEAEETLKQEQRDAGTRRLTKLQEKLDEFQAVRFLDECYTCDNDLEAKYDKKATKARKRKNTGGKRTARRNKASAKVQTRRKTAEARTVFNGLFGDNLSFKSSDSDSPKVKALDRQLSVLQSEKKRLLERLDTIEAEGETISPVVVKRLDRQIHTLSKKCQTLSAQRFQLAASPRTSAVRRL